jgi:hypothetical protein
MKTILSSLVLLLCVLNSNAKTILVSAAKANVLNTTSAYPYTTSIKLQWQVLEGFGAQGYNIYSNGQKINNALIESLSYEVTNLTLNTEYFFEIEAIDNFGNAHEIGNALYTTANEYNLTNENIVAQNMKNSATYNFSNAPFHVTAASSSIVLENPLVNETPVIIISDYNNNLVIKTITPNNNATNIDMKDVANGTYILKVVDKNNTIVYAKKILVDF